MGGRGTVAALALALLATGCADASTRVDEGATPTGATATAASAPTVPMVVEVLDPDVALAPADDEAYVNPGAVVHDGRRWVSLANSFTSFPGPSRVDVHVSDDLVSWERVGDAPVLTAGDVTEGRASVFLMSAVQDDDGAWVGFLYDYGGSTKPGHVHRATAPTPQGPWHVDPDPVLGPGPAGAWDALRVGEPEVVRTPDGRWWLWYVGVGEDRTSAIGLATSEDGVTWSREPEPVVRGDQGWTRGEVDDPQVVVTDEGLVMVYGSAVRGTYSRGLAFSDDGRTWTPWVGNPAMTADDTPEQQGIFQSALVVDDGAVRYLLESGVGAESTVVHTYAIDVAAARAADLPRLATEVEVDGDTVTVVVDVPGFELRFDPDGDHPTVVHPHVYVDLVPPRAGSPVPLGRPAIVHARADVVRVDGLDPGPHTLWVVLADGADEVVGHPGPVRVDVTVP